MTGLPRSLARQIDALVADIYDEVSLAREFNVPISSDRNGLFGADRLVRVQGGEAFRRLVFRTAREVGIEPALLAMNAFAERGSDVGTFLQRQPVFADEVGLDYWSSLGPAVRGRVPQAARIQSRQRSDTAFENEQGRVLEAYTFPNGPMALFALACAIKYYDLELRREAGSGGLSRLTRWALIRYAFNASPTRARAYARQAAAGRDVLERSGPVDWHHPLRTASVRTVQAIHLSQSIFSPAASP